MNQNHLDLILENCKYYDDIINYTPEENDKITKDLIRYYQDFVFFNWNQSDKIKQLDTVLNEYLKNRKFYQYIYNRFEEVGDVLPLYDVLVNLYNSYQIEEMKTVGNTKWI